MMENKELYNNKFEPINYVNKKSDKQYIRINLKKLKINYQLQKRDI